MTDQTVIYDAVQQRYGNIATNGGSCCGPDDCACTPTFYEPDQLIDLPVDVTGLSLGCGDPVTIADLRPGETVLDLGSGGGIDCFLSARQVGPTGYVIGVDMTPAMLEKANHSKAALGLTNVEFRQGMIEALPMDDAAVDIVMSNCVINLSPNKAAVFGEVFRVLKPGGRVSISDIVSEGEFTPDLRADLTRWAECVTGAIDVAAYTALMAAAGFTHITVVDKTDADDIVPRQPGMPRVYSARITAIKPA